MRRAGALLCGALFVAAHFGSDAAAALIPARGDGWHTWQVVEDGVSTEMCCFTTRVGAPTLRGCALDGGSVNLSDDADCGAAAGVLQVYVRIVDGKPDAIRVLSSNCPASAAGEIADHGVVTADDNLDWFRGVIEDRSLRRDVRKEALFGLVQSESDAAYVYIERLLTQNDSKR